MRSIAPDTAGDRKRTADRKQTADRERASDGRDDAVGVVLAGGRSTRFGDADKVFADLDGRALLERVVDRVGRVTGRVLVSCRRAQASAVRSRVGDRDVRVVPDPVPGGGPAAGLVASASRVPDGTRWLAVCAADAPFVSSVLLSALLERARAGVDCVIPVAPDGRRQPTQAVYRSDALAGLDGAGASLRSLVDRLDAAVVSPADVGADVGGRTFFDVDTPADYETARRLVG